MTDHKIDHVAVMKTISPETGVVLDRLQVCVYVQEEYIKAQVPIPSTVTAAYDGTLFILLSANEQVIHGLAKIALQSPIDEANIRDSYKRVDQIMTAREDLRLIAVYRRDVSRPLPPQPAKIYIGSNGARYLG